MYKFASHFLLLVFGLLTACSPKTSQQLRNQEITSYEGEPILVGTIDRNGLTQGPYRAWFAPNYGDFSVDASTLVQAKEALQQTEILLFMGTWCSDSQLQVPQFYKILDQMNYNQRKLTVVSLDNHPDRYKTSPGGQEKGWDIVSVPTFIFLRDGQELGRIVEYPEQTLEKDIARILLKE